MDGMQIFVFNYRNNEITAKVLAKNLEEAEKKLRHGDVVGVEVHFYSTWPEYWTLAEEEDYDVGSTD